MADHEVDSCAVASSDSETMDKKSRVRYYEHRKDNFGQMVDHPVPKPDPGSKERAEDDDYAIAWRLPLQDDEKDQDTRDARPTLLIESKVLRRALKQVDKGYTGIPFDTEKVAFSWPYELIYHGKKELEELEKISERGNEVLKRDIDILLEEVSKQQAAERNDAEKLAQEGQIRYDLLWTLFYPGKWVITTDTVREEQVFVIATHGIPSGDTSEGYQLDLWSIDFDGTKFACFESYVTIQPFKGAKAIDRLEAFPLDNWGGTVTESRDAVMKRLIQRGCLFENLCNGPPEGSFRQFDGPFIDHGPLDMLVGEKGTSAPLQGARAMTCNICDSTYPNLQDITHALNNLEQSS